MKEFFVYILCNKSRMLYVGVTSNLTARLWQHRERLVPGWPERYGVFRLVYYENTGDVIAAIEREKQIEGWVRRKKVALVSSANPQWKDLSEEWTAHPGPEILRSAQDDK
jgi:putative endonuclease